MNEKPSELIRAAIPAGETQEAFARRLRTTRYTVNQLLNGRRAITAPMALKLERVTKRPALFWLMAQAEYDLAKARGRQ